MGFVVSSLPACKEEAWCEEVRQEVASSEELPDRGSVAELLGSVVGTYEGTLRWHEVDEGIHVTRQAETSELRLEVLEAEGEAHWVVRRRGDDTLERLACFDGLEVPAELRLASTDGVLEGSWGVVLDRTATASHPEVELEPFDGHRGSFAVSVDPSLWDPSSVSLRWKQRFGDDGASAGLHLTVYRDGRRTWHQLASWSGAKVP